MVAVRVSVKVDITAAVVKVEEWAWAWADRDSEVVEAVWAALEASKVGEVWVGDLDLEDIMEVGVGVDQADLVVSKEALEDRGVGVALEDLEVIMVVQVVVVGEGSEGLVAWEEVAQGDDFSPARGNEIR